MGKDCLLVDKLALANSPQGLSSTVGSNTRGKPKFEKCFTKYKKLSGNSMRAEENDENFQFLIFFKV